MRDQKLEHCDQLLYKAQTQQDISKRLYAFIRANKSSMHF